MQQRLSNCDGSDPSRTCHLVPSDADPAYTDNQVASQFYVFQKKLPWWLTHASVFRGDQSTHLFAEGYTHMFACTGLMYACHRAAPWLFSNQDSSLPRNLIKRKPLVGDRSLKQCDKILFVKLNMCFLLFLAYKHSCKITIQPIYPKCRREEEGSRHTHWPILPGTSQHLQSC